MRRTFILVGVLFIIFLLINCCVPCDAAAGDTVKVLTANELPVTQREVYNDVKEVVKQLAESLSTTSEHVYGILVRQQIVKGVTDIIVMILVGIWTGLLHSKVSPFVNRRIKGAREDESEFGWVFICIVLWAGTIILDIFYILNISSILTQIINPEYAAIHEILDLLK